MFRSLKILLGALLLVFVAACAHPDGFEIRSHPAASNQVSAFDQALYSEYWPDAADESGEDDNFASDLHAKKGKAANSGATVLPEEVDSTPLGGHKAVHESELAGLTDARGKLMGFMDRGAREIRPTWTARAQVAFDCWKEEASERNARGGVLEPAHVAACKGNFNAAMAKIEPFLPPLAMPERLHMFDLMPDQGGPPQPAMAGAPDTYLVFFDWNKADLTPEALGIVRTAAANAKKSGSARVEVTGYADTSGAPDYNQRLSRRRADAVKAELVKQGVAGKNVTTIGKGETELLVPTPDGVREPQNRRARIVIHVMGK